MNPTWTAKDFQSLFDARNRDCAAIIGQSQSYSESYRRMLGDTVHLHADRCREMYAQNGWDWTPERDHAFRACVFVGFDMELARKHGLLARRDRSGAVTIQPCEQGTAQKSDAVALRVAESFGAVGLGSQGDRKECATANPSDS